MCTVQHFIMAFCAPSSDGTNLQLFKELLKADIDVKGYLTIVCVDSLNALMKMLFHNLEHPLTCLAGSMREGCWLPRMMATGQMEIDVLVYFVQNPLLIENFEDTLCLLEDKPGLCKIKKGALRIWEPYESAFRENTQKKDNTHGNDANLNGKLVKDGIKKIFSSDTDMAATVSEIEYHGPAVNFETRETVDEPFKKSLDYVPCIQMDVIPDSAKPWITRPRCWPDESIIQASISYSSSVLLLFHVL